MTAVPKDSTLLVFQSVVLAFLFFVLELFAFKMLDDFLTDDERFPLLGVDSFVDFRENRAGPLFRIENRVVLQTFLFEKVVVLVLPVVVRVGKVAFLFFLLHYIEGGLNHGVFGCRFLYFLLFLEIIRHLQYFRHFLFLEE